MRVNYKSIDKKLFYEFTCQNFDESETGLMQERDQKRDSAKNIFWKYFVMSQTKKDLKILLEQLHWLPLGEVVNFSLR